MKRTSLAAGRWATTAAVAVACGFASAPAARALGLGKLAVQSAIGESLRAEIDVSSLTPEEAADLHVRIAPPEAYRSAGVEYNPVLPGTQAVLQRRPDGRPYVRLTSDRSVLEPFVDVILEVTWSSGRLVREYTLLFDPPTPRNLAAASAPSPVLPAAEAPPPPSPETLAAAARAAASAAAAQRQPDTPPAVAAAPASDVPPLSVARQGTLSERPPAAVAAAPTALAAAALPARRTPSASPAASDAYTVRRGDTLSHIAARTQPAGVSLDQMLVALYQGNPEAFVGNNMNRLRAGVVLAVPSAETARAVAPDAARQTIQAQSADFGAYRQRLASGALPAGQAAPGRQASGTVQAQVQDRRDAAAPANDKLTLSRGAASAAMAEDAISKQRDRQAAHDRLAELNKNLRELSQLSAAASQSARSAAVVPPSSAAVAVAAASQPRLAAAAVPLAVPVPTSLPPPPVTAASSAALAASTAPAAPLVGASAAASAPVAVAMAPSAALTHPASAPVVAAVRPRTPASVPTAPPPSDEAVGTWWSEQPWLLPLAGVLAVLVAGLAYLRARKSRAGDVAESSFLESRLQPDSFFGASGGQRIDTHEASGGVSSMSYSLSQLDAIGDVDPVAEADVYLAYGRDLQAEEILKEAMRGNPERMAIRTKLLEVYAKRRDTKGFEMLATQLYKLTGGTGDDWARAQELGLQIDPENALYQPGGVPAMAELGEPERAVDFLGASTLPQSVLPSPSQFGAEPSGGPAALGARADEGSLDLNLDFDLGDRGSAEPPQALSEGDDFLEFLGRSQPTPLDPPGADAPSPASPDLFEADEQPDALNFAPTQVQPADPPPLRPSPERPVPVAEAAPAAAAAPVPAPPDAPLEFDLSSISLDFDPAPKPAAAEMQELDLTPTAAGELFDEDDGSDPLERKLDLAQEFHQIGDMEGARELLQEVMDRASGGLKDRAERLMLELGA